MNLSHRAKSARQMAPLSIPVLVVSLVCLLTGCTKSEESSSAEKGKPGVAATTGTGPSVPNNLPDETKAQIAKEMAEAQEHARQSVAGQQKNLPQKP